MMFTLYVTLGIFVLLAIRMREGQRRCTWTITHIAK